jgi:hypothetical protein
MPTVLARRIKSHANKWSQTPYDPLGDGGSCGLQGLLGTLQESPMKREVMKKLY